MEYRYLFITINDSDFYTALDSLGNIIVNVFCDSDINKLLNDGECAYKTVIHLLYSFIALSGSRAKVNYVKSRLRIESDSEEIKEMLEIYGMSGHGNSHIFDDSESLKALNSISFNASALVVKLAFSENGNYSRDCSAWEII